AGISNQPFRHLARVQARGALRNQRAGRSRGSGRRPVAPRHRMNLFEQQSANRRKTWLIMLAFVGFLFVLGLGFDAFYLGASCVFFPIGSLAALGVGSISAAASYFNGDKAVLASTHAEALDTLVDGADQDRRLKLRQLDNIVEEMAIAAGLPKPRVYVVP